MNPRVLVVDDEAPQREIFSAILGDVGFDAEVAAGGDEALSAVRANPPDVVLTDLRMAGKNGLELLEELHRAEPDLPVVLVTAHGSIDAAVQAMKAGAFDFVSKPVRGDELVMILRRALERTRLLRENKQLRAELDVRTTLRELVADHGSMREVFRLVQRVAPTHSTVLIYGETGTGKELVARAIHSASKRADGQFVAVNCAAIPANLLESELFGHERGAFTGAVARRIGLFEQAQGGTLFLDEIGDLPLELQPKLLRVLQERQITRVGSSTPISVDARVISATHRDVTSMVEDQALREDLYWRLNVFPIKVPPLRERATDIPALVAHFLARFAEENDEPPKRIGPDAMGALMAYRWPGNVRQLQATVERLCLTAETPEIEVSDLPPELVLPHVVLSASANFVLPDDGFVFEDFERDLIRQAMERSSGVISKAARQLGMSYRTLQYRLEKFGLRSGE
ncbi:MAG: sigma-54-dependent Fis family transcriptional regulator [Deltaproteobacteria bacterium]|nr:sigma-54-dependent Fis family transcriptional regulator [Deltaproteobacteria bacterium]